MSKAWVASCRLPRRIVMLYLTMAGFVFVLLFPFYWLAITAVKPNSQLTDYNNHSPFWVVGTDRGRS